MHEELTIHWFGTPMNENHQVIKELSEDEFQELHKLYNERVKKHFPKIKFDKIIAETNNLVGYGAIIQYNDQKLINDYQLASLMIFVENMFYDFRQSQHIIIQRDSDGNFLKRLETTVDKDRYSYFLKE